MRDLPNAPRPSAALATNLDDSGDGGAIRTSSKSRVCDSQATCCLAPVSRHGGKFARLLDSLLERNVLELPIPRENGYRSKSSGFDYLSETVRVSPKGSCRPQGTEVSDPLPSSAEAARHQSLVGGGVAA